MPLYEGTIGWRADRYLGRTHGSGGGSETALEEQLRDYNEDKIMKTLSRAFEKFNSHAMYERMTMRQMLTIGGRRPFHAKAHAFRNVAKFAAACRAAKEKKII